MVLPPADAPRDALVSGKFAGLGNIRVDAPGSVMGDTGAMHGNRQTGIAFPFIGQPVQGFSGIKPVANEPGHYWVLTDNGFGNRRNSPDALLMFHKVKPDFATGQVSLLQTTFLRDPLRRIPFPTPAKSACPGLGECNRIAFAFDIAGIGVHLVQKQKPGRHGTQPDRAIGARQHQNAAGEFLGQHGIATIARAGGCHAFPQRRCFLQQWVNALAGEALAHDALARLDSLWEELFPAEQQRIIHALVDRVVVGPTGADIRLRVEGLGSLARDLGDIVPDALRAAA